MRLHEIYKPQSSKNEIITEAARFGNREIRQTIANSKLFNIGVEYEFNVERGESWSDELDSISGEYYESEMNKFILSSADDITSIVGSDLDQLYLEISELERTLSNSSGISEKEQALAQFNEYTLPEIIDSVKRFDTITKNANIYKKVVDGDQQIYGGYGYPTKKYNFDKNVVNLQSVDFSNLDELLNRFGNMNKLLSVVRLVRTTVSALYNYVTSDAKHVSSDMSMSELINTVSNKLKNSRKISNDKFSKVDFVKSNLPVDRKFIENIEYDASVPNGVEVITRPLSLSDSIKVLKMMTEYIKSNGGTNNQTGLHFNVSLKTEGFRDGNFNAVKVVTLLDPQYFQRDIKYPLRDPIFVKDIFSPLTSDKDAGENIVKLARYYVNGGTESLIQNYEKLLSKSGKNRSVNIETFFSSTTKRSDRRIEFRFLGGAGYENRFNELVRDLVNICYVMMLGTSDSVSKRDYIDSILRILDRGTKLSSSGQLTSFSEVIELIRKGKI